MSSVSNIDRKVRKKKKGLILILLILLISVFFILLTKTSLFTIKDARVLGNKTLDKERIILASGLIMEENILRVNTNIIKDNLLLHPYIKNVTVRRKLPNIIEINIEEREEAAVITYIGSYIYIDNDGIILNILNSKKDEHFVEIDGLSVKNIIIGDKLELEGDNDIGQVLDIISESKDLGILNNITKLQINESFDLNILLDSGTNVAFGDINNVKYKLNFLNEILTDLRDKDINCSAIYLDKGDNAVIIKDSN